MAYHLRTVAGGKAIALALLAGGAMAWHFGVHCRVLFDEAGIAVGAWEYGAERPCREVTGMLGLAGLLLLLMLIGSTAQLTPNLLRCGFLSLLHTRSFGRIAMILPAFLVQWVVLASGVGSMYLVIGAAWGILQGTWTPWLPGLAAAYAVEAGGIASLLLFFGLIARRRAVSALLTILVGIVVPSVVQTLITLSDEGSLIRECATLCFVLIPRTLFASHAVIEGMAGRASSGDALVQIPMATLIWVVLSVVVFVRRDC
jgi:hypothetical protein